MKYLYFGAIYIKSGKYKGRIGYFDDIERTGNSEKAIIYFGHPLFCNTYDIIAFKHLDYINTHILFERLNYLGKVLYLENENNKEILDTLKITYLEELNYINIVLNDRMFDAMFNHEENTMNIFLSHSSKDKNFVKSLAVDLKQRGVSVWLDEWEINIGESIPSKINQGLENCQYLALILSKNSVESKWVENEWQAKYWEELEIGKICLLPILIEECPIPKLLKHKKYADFTKGYGLALEELITSIFKLKSY